mmetsp:Transcript_6013/g.20534  ORF Transcript_6013/g.20534 Transcript_6013/m.20534 type:complete len:300 (-) Transcript_6013:365-1264(-)
MVASARGSSVVACFLRVRSAYSKPSIFFCASRTPSASPTGTTSLASWACLRWMAVCWMTLFRLLGEDSLCTSAWSKKEGVSGPVAPPSTTETVWFDRGQHAHTKVHGFGSMRCAADASATPKACERRLRFASSFSSCESLKMRPRVATLTWKVSGASRRVKWTTRAGIVGSRERMLGARVRSSSRISKKSAPANAPRGRPSSAKVTATTPCSGNALSLSVRGASLRSWRWTTALPTLKTNFSRRGRPTEIVADSSAALTWAFVSTRCASKQGGPPAARSQYRASDSRKLRPPFLPGENS